VPKKPTPAHDPEPSVSATGKPPGWHLFFPVLLILAGVAVYADALTDPFILDDVPRIVENPSIQSVGDSLHGHQPITQLSLALNYAMGGLGATGYHVVNVVIHVLAALTLFGLLRRTLTTDRLAEAYGRGATWIAFCVALLWMIHPLATESVTYVSQRSESLMGLFYLLTLYCLIRGATGSRGVCWLIAAVVCCGLGMGSKAVMVSAPIVAMAFDRIFLAESTAQMLKRRFWVHLLLVATWFIPVGTGVVKEVLDPNHVAEVGFGVRGITPVEYAMTQPGVVLQYLKLSIWPKALCVNYHWTPVRTLFESGAIGIVIVAVLLVWTLVALWRRPAHAFLGVWFFLVLAPTSSFIPMSEPLAEHRMYLPLVAVVLAVVLAARGLLLDVFGAESVARRGITAVLMLLVATPLAYATVRRNQDYRSEDVMWQDVVAKRPNNPAAYLALGKAAIERNALDEAEAVIRHAMALGDVGADAHFLLGVCLAKKNMPQEALDELSIAAELGRDDVALHTYMGRTAAKLSLYDQAIEHYEKAMQRQPDVVTTMMGYANALFMAGRAEEAIALYERVLAINPQHFDALKSYSMALAKVERFEDALEAADKALKIDPSDKDLVFQRSLILKHIPKP